MCGNGNDLSQVSNCYTSAHKGVHGTPFSGEKARMLSFRNRIEVIPVRDIRSLRGYLKGIDTTFVRDGDRV